MKEMYLKPQIDVEKFDTEVIFTASNGDVDPGDNDVVWGS